MTFERPRVVLTDRIDPEAAERLAAQADVVLLGDPGAEDLPNAIREADALIVRRQLPAAVFEQPNSLRAVVRHGVGLDFIPVERATAAGIPVANTPSVNANAVAEYVLAAMLAQSRRLAEYDRAVREGDWQVRLQAGRRTFDLRGRSVGVVGFGAIGRRVAEIAGALGMRVAACSTTASKLPTEVPALALEALFEASDFIVLACPLTAATRAMVDSRVLQHARRGATLINVARGPVVVEADLARALQSGQLGGAVLDVHATQPLPATSALRDCPNVVLTPHLAGMTADSERAMGLMAVDTALALLRGERPGNVVNPEVYKRNRG